MLDQIKNRLAIVTSVSHNDPQRLQYVAREFGSLVEKYLHEESAETRTIQVAKAAIDAQLARDTYNIVKSWITACQAGELDVTRYQDQLEKAEIEKSRAEMWLEALIKNDEAMMKRITDAERCEWLDQAYQDDDETKAGLRADMYSC
jgi:hypothetical protein